MHSGTGAVPAFHCQRVFKGTFSTRWRFENAPTRCLPLLKRRSKNHFDTLRTNFPPISPLLDPRQNANFINTVVSAFLKEGPLMRKKKTMTMTKIPSRKPSGTYGHGPLKICFSKGKDDDHDQDFLKKDLLHIWSWSSDKSFSSDDSGLTDPPISQLSAPQSRVASPAIIHRRHGHRKELPQKESVLRPAESSVLNILRR